MPANFGEIASYHNRLAIRHIALAQAAREAGDLNAADYQTQLAVRYIEAAQEQSFAMSQVPGISAARPASRPWATGPNPAAKRIPSSAPLAASCLSVIRRGAGSIATALQHSISRRSAPIQSLSLR